MGNTLSEQTRWEALRVHGARLEPIHLRDLFACNPRRFEKLSFRLDDLLIDFSKERIDPEALACLVAFAHESGLAEKIAALFSGEPVNVTEGRAAMHMALRGHEDDSYCVNGVPVMPEVIAQRDRFLDFAEDVRRGVYLNAKGASFRDVVNIGIGGSDLGPVMATRALFPECDGPKVHFVSNVDGAHLADTLLELKPEHTLFIVASKTFGTLETLENAKSARGWLMENGIKVQDIGGHFVAISANIPAAEAFGIEKTRIFGFADWVGGRYSLWSSIGLSIAIAIGRKAFLEFLKGARAMDMHFRDTRFEANLPVLMGLLGVWRCNILGAQTVALIPYDQRLEHFSAYMQQLVMESNGKSVQINGHNVQVATSPMIWGEPGTNAQHSFFQLLHQGTHLVPVDFLVIAKPNHCFAHMHSFVLANALAQSEALAFGRRREDVVEAMRANGASEAKIERIAAHRTFEGNRPSSVLVFRELSPYALGRLIALYEHKTFVEGALWNINPFDQWGVELGKELASTLVPIVKGEASPASKESSTARLIEYLAGLAEKGHTHNE